MKIFRYIATIAAAACLFLACRGNVDSDATPILTVSDTEIDLATETSASLSVSYDNEDVTSKAIIYMDGDICDSIFTPEEEGTYTFVAKYDAKESNTVTVNVINTKVVVESKYKRHVFVTEFTGAWCNNCPKGYTNMMGVLSKPSLAKYKDYIHFAAFHSNAEGKDDMAIEDTQVLFKQFPGLSYPAFVTDFREYGVLTDDGLSLFQPSLIASFEEYPAHCGVAVSSKVNSGKAEVTVKVTSEKTDDYRVLVLALENRINYPQKTPVYPDGDDSYIHNHVVRKVVSSYTTTLTGEKISDSGEIKNGEEKSKTWTFDVDSNWKLENCEVYAVVIDGTGYVNNMNHCSIDGGNADYDLK